MRENTKRRLVIAGLGLIGGSLALALQKRADWMVSGVDRDDRTLELAHAAGIDARRPEQAGDLLAQADLLILALPPAGAISFLQEQGDRLRPGAAVSDVCGVKREVVKACEAICRPRGLHFVGGHPMAGKERSGFQNADGNLFQGASYILTPLPDSHPGAVAMLEKMAKDMGCGTVTVTDPAHHDRMIAFTSQLPHVLAGAYVKSPACPEHAGYSAGSYRDVSRVATVDEALWTQLFLMNRDYLCAEIDGLIQNLAACRDAIAKREPERLREILREGRLRKEGAPD